MKNKIKILILVFLIIAIAILFLVRNNNDINNKKDEINIVLGSEPNSLDPAISLTIDVRAYMSHLFEVKENIEVKPVEKEKIIITSMEELKTKPIVEESLEKETKTDVVDNEDYYRLPRFSEIFDPLKPKKNNNTSFTQSNKEILERVLKDFEDFQELPLKLHLKWLD